MPSVDIKEPSGLSAVTPAQWERLAGRKIFFGHQSVGDNIIAGVRQIEATNPQIQVRVVSSKDPSGVNGPALVETHLGANENPVSKSAEFAAIVERGLGPGGGVAFYKFCYVDVNPATDPAALFRQYQATVEAVRSAHPEVTIAHVTVPLVALGTPRAYLARLLGRSGSTDAQKRRLEYNRLLLEAYGGREPVFDLARWESTRPDGTRSYVRWGGEQMYSLAQEWSADGGHLNAAGRQWVGEHFLVFLAGL